jgi:hypothetical protein
LTEVKPRAAAMFIVESGTAPNRALASILRSLK